MDLTPVANYLERQNVGVVGKDVFVEMLPTDAEGVVIKHSVPFKIDHEMPDYRNGRFQAIVRKPEFVAGQNLAATVKEALTVYEAQWPEFYVKRIVPREDPFPFPSTAAGFIEFSLNLEAVLDVG